MKLLSVLGSLLIAAAVAVQATPHAVKDALKAIPSGWKQVSRADPSTSVDLIFLVRQQNVAALEQTLYAVSDPTSPAYGQHLTREEINDMVAPLDQDVSQVMQWISHHGIRTAADTLSSSDNSDIVRVSMSVGQAEKLLHTKYFEYEHVSRKTNILRCSEYSLPTFLSDVIDAVGPTVRFPSDSTIRASKGPKHYLKQQHKQGVSVGAPLDNCAMGTTPACLRQMYNLGTYTANSNTTLAVTGYLEQYIAPSDLAAFFAALDPSNARNATIYGPNDATNPGTEASLDIQYSMGVAPGVPGVFWYTAGRQPNSTDNEPFLDFLLTLSNTDAVPWVISTSYGDNEPTVDFTYASRMNVEFQKLGARGVSILYSSGDGGVAGGQPTECTNFIPTYPAGSPFVTSVGGTTGSNPETAVSFSSGGFANYWSSPSYQTAAVQQYLTEPGTNLPPAGLWNATGRGFPDVAAAGTSYLVWVSGSAQPVDGTSCSTPTFSGIVSLLNDIRFQAGKSSLGFLNPLLYQNPGMLNDITSGNNPGCGTNGFSAAKGWDPVTGLGSPNFTAMSKVVSALP